jgi:2-polyprenyl-3-methyl-5-hydroxy-6-metoxy-1,4-benzoquinol methylase
MVSGQNRRRDGDAIAIAGDYQARALESPRAAQRFWHAAKLRIIDRVAPAKSGARIADAGCGSGVISAHLASKGGDVIGFDSNPAAVEYATVAYASPNLRFVLGPFERIVEQGPFDQFYCLEVVEHLYEEQAIDVLGLFARAARPGAELFVTTPNARSAWPAIEWTLDRLQLVPTLAGDQHLTAFTRGSLARAMSAAGWRVDEIGTFNGIAPFLAPISERAAHAAESIELKTSHFMPWNLLYCRASYQVPTASTAR